MALTEKMVHMKEVRCFMNRTKTAAINGAFLLGTLIINTLGALGVINGLSQKEISDRFMTLITPSPSTFSIWSVIYTFLIISIVVMLIKKNDLYYQKAIDEITVLFRISCGLNILWIVTFSFVLIELSALFIFGFAIVLAMICQKIAKMQTGKRFLLPLTFGLYTGWLFIATVVNIAAALVKIDWDGFGISEELWAVATLSVSVVLVFLVLQRLKNVAFPLPVAWAYLGIYQFLIAPNGFNGQYVLLQMTALGGMAVLIGMAAIRLYQNGYGLLPDVAGQSALEGE